ncbi:MAG: MarR family winged helix-turn-helix transcriptional regulator [Pusillimonas sp.]
MIKKTEVRAPMALHDKGPANKTGDRVAVVEPDQLNNSLAYVVRRTGVRCDATFIRHQQGEISPARFCALSAVAANPGINQSALGVLLGIANPSVVKVVDDLAQLGLVERTAGLDRRSSALYLTPAGDEKLRRYSDALEQCEREIAEALTLDERTQLLALLRKVALGGGDA